MKQKYDLHAVQRTLTILFHMYFCSFIFPEDTGWRRADDVTNNVGVVSFSKLLGWGCICEGDFFWNITCKTCFTHWNWNMNLINAPSLPLTSSAGKKYFYSQLEIQPFVKHFLKILFHLQQDIFKITQAISFQFPAILL